MYTLKALDARQLYVPGNTSMSLTREVQLHSTFQPCSKAVENLEGAVRLHHKVKTWAVPQQAYAYSVQLVQRQMQEDMHNRAASNARPACAKTVVGNITNIRYVYINCVTHMLQVIMYVQHATRMLLVVCTYLHVVCLCVMYMDTYAHLGYQQCQSSRRATQ